MAVCRNCQLANGRRYSYTGVNALRTITVVCDDCARELSAIGMDLRVAPEEPRRRFPARDLTGWITGPSVA